MPSPSFVCVCLVGTLLLTGMLNVTPHDATRAAWPVPGHAAPHDHHVPSAPDPWQLRFATIAVSSVGYLPGSFGVA